MGGSLAPGYSNIPVDVGKEPQGPPPLPARTVEGIVDLVMPLYYTKEQITPDELVAAKKLWRMIVNNQSEYFFEFQRELRKAGGTPPELGGEYLLNLWVLRLLDIHPQAKPLFEKVDRTKMRIHFLSMITMLIDCAGDDPEKFKKSLQGLVKAHGVIGVRSCEFGIGAEIMMYCVKKCLGPKICTPAVMFVFAKFFSRVLEIMLPLSIQQEMAGNITNRRPEGPLVKH